MPPFPEWPSGVVLTGQHVPVETRYLHGANTQAGQTPALPRLAAGWAAGVSSPSVVGRRAKGLIWADELLEGQELQVASDSGCFKKETTAQERCFADV